MWAYKLNYVLFSILKLTPQSGGGAFCLFHGNLFVFVAAHTALRLVKFNQLTVLCFAAVAIFHDPLCSSSSTINSTFKCAFN